MRTLMAALGCVVLWWYGTAIADEDHSRHDTTAPAARHVDQAAGQAFAFGEPGDPRAAGRTLHINAYDTMKYSKQTITVRKGETVRFVVRNDGRLPHEFVLGDARSQTEHAKMMKAMPGMKHAHANALVLAPGEVKTLYWRFTGDAELEVGCHVPGHYEAGMRMTVRVKP